LNVSSKKLRRIFDSGAAPLLAAVALFVTEEAFAANNPLDTIMAANYDAKSGMIKTESSSEGGNDICSIHNGDFVVYKDYDFDSGVAAFKARIASIRKGSIEIRLDSPVGRLMGVCPFDNSGGWQEWEDVRCKVDNSQAGPRDVYLVFHGQGTGALVNVRSFVFLKSIVMNPSEVPLGFPDRVDVVDDEPQGTNSWGMPEAGFTDDFEHGDLSNWIAKGISITTNAVEGGILPRVWELILILPLHRMLISIKPIRAVNGERWLKHRSRQTWSLIRQPLGQASVFHPRMPGSRFL